MNSLYFVIPMFILFIFSLVALTIMLSKYNMAQQAQNDMKIWCWDDFYCKNVCEISGGHGVTPPNSDGVVFPVDKLFTESWMGKTGLASGLFGVDSDLNKYCQSGTTGGASPCENCPDNFKSSNVKNCFQGCTNGPPTAANNAYCNPKTT